MMRIGHGYDVHKLVEGRKLILGGVEIPHSLGLLGHSDADVLTHAVMDALLGAAGLGDIGQHFPDTDDRFLGIDSQKLLTEVCGKIRAAGYEISNLDATVIAQKPKLMAYLPQMRETLTATMGIPLSSLNLKATTEEHLGFTGRQEGIAAHCVCLLESK
jgi:2-C-methyl-D-erythritol 2,4-cyclodiphosphate synthase